MNIKYKFSIGRIIIRVALSLFLSIIFGLLIIPFLQTADGLYDMQQAQIGQQNLWKVVFLWGLFTVLVGLITFIKKHFRMVTIFLLICWIFGTGIVTYATFFYDRGIKECKRAQTYSLENEFNRTLDLISQRLEITDSTNTFLGIAFQYKNCINIQYSTEIGADLEGAFVESDPTLQNLPIFLKTQYKTFDDLTLATVLVHELTHAGIYIDKINNNTNIGCFENEAEAFMSEVVFFNQLNDEERRSIYSRLKDNISSNPAFEIILLFEERGNEVFKSCEQIKKTNLLNEEQFNDCYWQGMKNKLTQDIKTNKYYQQQCGLYD